MSEQGAAHPQPAGGTRGAERCAGGAWRPAARARIVAEARGVALPGVLLLAAFLVGVTGWLVGHVRTDLLLAMGVEDEQHTARLAGAAAEAVALGLAQVADWAPVDALALALPCSAAPVPLLPFDESQERAWLQASTDAASRWGADTPQWRMLWMCHAPGVLGRWPERGAAPVVAVWVADEPEGDAVPLVSGNQRLLLQAVARGRAGARGAVALTIERPAAGAPVVLVAWRGAAGR